MKRVCTETFAITSKAAGQHNNKYDDVWPALEAWKRIPEQKRNHFGITCIEEYAYYKNDMSFSHRETFESWIPIEDYLDPEEIK